MSEKVWFVTGTSTRHRHVSASLSSAYRGDPLVTGPAIVEIVDADEPPLRVFLGSGPLTMIREEYERRLETWEQWDALSQAAHGAVER